MFGLAKTIIIGTCQKKKKDYLIRKGNFLMNYEQGVFGVLNADAMEDEPLLLLDGGIERRNGETYDFDNGARESFRGFLFQYTLRGEGIFIRNGREYRVRPGDGFFVSLPEDSRYCLPDTPGAEWEFLYLHFAGPAALPFAGRLNALGKDVIFLDPESRPVRMAMDMQRRLVKGGRLERYEGGEFLYGFLCGLLREAENSGIRGRDSLAQKAAEYIRQEYSHLQGVEEVAAVFKVSPAHLSRCFKKEMGIPPSEFLNRQRVQAAMNQLLGTEKTVKEIGEENGFSCGNYFGKVFRRYAGVSPEIYRMRNRI